MWVLVVYRMLLKSKSSTPPRSEAASAASARPNRYWRRRSTFQRSSQSTFMEPGDATGRFMGGVSMSGGEPDRTAAEPLRCSFMLHIGTEHRGDMAHVARIDWSFVDHAGGTTTTSAGLARQRIVGPEQGAVHTDLAVGAL